MKKICVTSQQPAVYDYEYRVVLIPISVDVYLNKLFIIVAVPYLMAVANFFTDAMPKVEGKQKAAVQKHTDVICKLHNSAIQVLAYVLRSRFE